MTKKLNILFPIENINRDLDFRLFLAVMCVNANNRIFVGQHNFLDKVVSHTKGGVYVGKNIFKEIFPNSDKKYYNAIKNRGYSFIHLSEEGAVYQGGEDQWRKSLKLEIDPIYLEAEDFLCAWGNFQADFYRSLKPACIDNIFPTGHPRFDLYKSKYQDFFADDTARIKEKYGDFVLINTSFTFANNGLGVADTFSARNNYFPADEKGRMEFVEFWTYIKQVLSRVVQLVHRLSIEFPNLNFIVRPHPAEEMSFYRDIFAGVKNIHVVHEGAVAPWLRAGKMLIHDGCTTGIEAFLSDTPVVSYKAIPGDKNNIYLPDAVGVRCFEENEVIEYLEKVLAGKADLEKLKEDFDPLVGDLLANFQKDSFESLAQVVTMAENQAREKTSDFEWSSAGLQKTNLISNQVETVKNIIRPFFKNKHKTHLFFNQQFYKFDDDLIKPKLEQIKQILGKDFDYKIHNKYLLTIEQD